ncbi:MAG: hypothetical protein Q9160_006540 [Pyrenula sp. 1 TL-2023]
MPAKAVGWERRRGDNVVDMVKGPTTSKSKSTNKDPNEPAPLERKRGTKTWEMAVKPPPSKSKSTKKGSTNKESDIELIGAAKTAYEKARDDAITYNKLPDYTKILRGKPLKIPVPQRIDFIDFGYPLPPSSPPFKLSYLPANPTSLPPFSKDLSAHRRIASLTTDITTLQRRLDSVVIVHAKTATELQRASAHDIANMKRELEDLKNANRVLEAGKLEANSEDKKRMEELEGLVGGLGRRVEELMEGGGGKGKGEGEGEAEEKAKIAADVKGEEAAEEMLVADAEQEQEEEQGGPAPAKGEAAEGEGGKGDGDGDAAEGDKGGAEKVEAGEGDKVAEGDGQGKGEGEGEGEEKGEGEKKGEGEASTQ